MASATSPPPSPAPSLLPPILPLPFPSVSPPSSVSSRHPRSPPRRPGSCSHGQRTGQIAGAPVSADLGPGPPLVVPDASPLGGPAVSPASSWRDVCAGKVRPERFALDPCLFEGKVKISEPSGESNSAEICFDSSVMISLAEAWKLALVFRPVGSRILLEFMDQRIQSVFNIKGGFLLSDLPNGFFMLNLSLEEDFHRILAEGPWSCFGCYLTVRPWTLDFDPLTANFNTSPVWVRIHRLPVVFYEESALRFISSCIGKPMSIDLNTLLVKRGKFARVSVCVDLSIRLPDSIVVQGVRYQLEFEKLGAVCFNCGVFGHFKASCPAVSAVPTSLNRRDSGRAGTIAAQLDKGKCGGIFDRISGDGWRIKGKIKKWLPKSVILPSSALATGLNVVLPTSSEIFSLNRFEVLEGIGEPGVDAECLEVSANGMDLGPICVQNGADAFANLGMALEIEDCAPVAIEGLECQAVAVLDVGSDAEKGEIMIKDSTMRGVPNSLSFIVSSPSVEASSVGRCNSGLKRGFFGPTTRSKALASSSSYVLDPGPSSALISADDVDSGVHIKQKAKKQGFPGARPRLQ